MSRQTERTSSLILTAAWRRLARGDAARLADVAKDAGVSRQALYLHFGSRAGLLVALTQHIDRTLGLDVMLREVAAISSPREQLIAGLRLTARFAPKIQSVAISLARLRTVDADARAAFDERMEFRRRGIERIVRAIAREEGLASEWTVRRATDVLWAAGLPQTWELLVTERGWSPSEFERWLVRQGSAMLAPIRKRRRSAGRT